MPEKKEDFGKLSIEQLKNEGGLIEINNKVKLKNTRDLSTAYTPGVATPCLEIQKDESKFYDYTINGKTVAVVTDGSSVLGLGNIGPKAALPVMEGKSALFKKFGDVNAYPIALDTQDTQEIIQTVKMLAPSFAGINLEDISAPRCFEIEETLKKELDIPVFHDDQHGTAIVVLAGLINALKITDRSKRTCKIVINGAGAAGVAITKLLLRYGFTNIIICDSKGIISKSRDDLNPQKQELVKQTNELNLSGDLKAALRDADVFIGVSKANLLNENDIRTMEDNAIIFALANPDPEILPDVAKKGGAKIIATGRSDFPNQINNVLVFPGIFKGAIEARCSDITDDMKLEAARALADLIKKPTPDRIIPQPFDRGIADAIAKAVKSTVRN